MSVEYLTEIRRADGSMDRQVVTSLSDAIPTEGRLGDHVKVFTVVESADGLDILNLLMEWEEDLTGPNVSATL